MFERDSRRTPPLRILHPCFGYVSLLADSNCIVVGWNEKHENINQSLVGLPSIFTCRDSRLKHFSSVQIALLQFSFRLRLQIMDILLSPPGPKSIRQVLHLPPSASGIEVLGHELSWKRAEWASCLSQHHWGCERKESIWSRWHGCDGACIHYRGNFGH